MVIDFHVHINLYGRGDEDIGNLLRADDAAGIDQSVVFCPENDFTLKAARAHPDRLIPFGWVEWGRDEPRKIDHLADQGARGLKAMIPAYGWNDARLEPYYARAEARGLPLLAHTGVMATGENVEHLIPPALTDSSRMKIIYLDAPCRRFPGLTFVAAHLGNPDHEEGSMLVRWHPNFYFDLSGSSLLLRTHDYWRQLFWWDRRSRFTSGVRYTKKAPWRPFEKMLFATDTPYEFKAEVMAEQRALLEALEQPREIIDRVFGGTAAEILRLRR